jgi:UDP-glucose 4-epimerase
LTGSSSKIEHKPVRAGDVKHSMASVDKLTAAGFKPSGDFDAALKKTIQWFKAGMGY